MNYITKDISKIESPAVIMHGVNCQRVMASGVAKALFDKWPAVKDEYLKFTKEQMFLGKASFVEIENNLYVINCWTQYSYGYDQKIYADISAIRTCLAYVLKITIEKGIKYIYSPPVGCGLGGLNWSKDVEPIFAEAQNAHADIVITICNVK